MSRRYHFETSPAWWVALAVSGAFTLLLLVSITYLFYKGVGIWGINIPVGWGFAITNFVWWIGIGHAGTFISAFLYLMRQEWRTPISRFAESMTIFAVVCAGMFPLLHLGRPWFFYWLAPYPNTMSLWPQFRSPLVWDLFAVSTYLTISLLFWYVGLVPDLAMMRDNSKSKWGQRIYGAFALGWRGSGWHWRYYKKAYILFAGLAAPLVVSVHSIVGMDFAYGVVPGWHSTIFPPYFVAGAIFSGFAMVLTIGIIVRPLLKLEDLITNYHLDMCARFVLATGVIVAYGYIAETFNAYYGGNFYDIDMIRQRFFGPYAVAAWTMIFCNVVVPQVLWSHRVRNTPWMLFVAAAFIQLGMWLERYVIVISSTSRDFLVSSWHVFHATFWDWSTLAGSIGLFCFCYLLYLRFLPFVSIAEVREDAHNDARREKLEKTEGARA